MTGMSVSDLILFPPPRMSLILFRSRIKLIRISVYDDSIFSGSDTPDLSQNTLTASFHIQLPASENLDPRHLSLRLSKHS